MSRRRIMARNRAEIEVSEASPYAAMSKDQLADLFREKGGKGVPEGWPNATIIRKLEEL